MATNAFFVKPQRSPSPTLPRKRERGCALAIAAVSGFLTVFPACAARAQDAVENFYRGKTVTILIGHPAGGSYDLYARLAAAHFGKYIPGHPQVLVQSKPGGAGAGAVQFLYGYGPKDGTLLGLFSETIALTQLVQPEIGKWRMQELVYIGAFANVNAVFMMRKDSPAKTIDELKSIEVKVGCSSRLSKGYLNPSILKAYAGLKFRIVCGYPGSMEFPHGVGARRSRHDLELVECVADALRRRRRHVAADDPGGAVATQGAAEHPTDAGAARPIPPRSRWSSSCRAAPRSGARSSSTARRRQTASPRCAPRSTRW